MPVRGRDRQTNCQWQWRQPQSVQWSRKESRRTSETPQCAWLGGAQKGILWLCYAGPLAEKRKSLAPMNSRLNEMVRSPTPIGLGRNGCLTSRGFQLPRGLPFYPRSFCKYLVKGYNKQTCRLLLYTIPFVLSTKQGSCEMSKSFGMIRLGK